MILRRLSLAGAIAFALMFVTTAGSGGSTPPLLLGGYSKDWAWYDTNVGPVDIYRGYDFGWHFATWQQTDAYKAHPDAAQFDYSFNLPPGELGSGLDDTKVASFLATTPKNLIVTNWLEPEDQVDTGVFTAAQYRSGITRLASLVRAQNSRDGGTRRVSVILMVATFSGYQGRNPDNFWPVNPTTGANVADLISADAYALPHNTNTACCPPGYTDGERWKTAATLLGRVRVFASAHTTAWGVSELGYLEDVNSPTHRANTITDVVAYARANGAVMVEYWDAAGRRAAWQLRYNNPPVPSTSPVSNAVLAWKAAVNS